MGDGSETTLGADNGIGVSAILAVLESDELKHGPIEALFTYDEETGMYGAIGLKPGELQGKILLNTDSEQDGELYISCAGGIDVNVSFRYKEDHILLRMRLLIKLFWKGCTEVIPVWIFISDGLMPIKKCSVS